MEVEKQNPFLNVREAGDFLRLKKRTLDNMRWMGTGPSFRKHGGRIFFHIDELKEWSLALRAKSTSQLRLTTVIATT
jgi:hypothetical protein